MEFTYIGTVYFDVHDYMVADFVENWGDGNLDDYLFDYVAGFDDCDYYKVEPWMVKAVKEEMLKYEAVRTKVEEDI